MRKFILLTAAAALFSLVLAVPAQADESVEFITSGPISDDDEAQVTCRKLCRELDAANPGSDHSWTGDWRPIENGKRAVCKVIVD
jgi:hypothetical protein